MSSSQVSNSRSGDVVTFEEGQLDRPNWAGETPLSRLVTSLISFKPLYSILKFGARQVLISTAEKNNVPWRKMTREVLESEVYKEFDSIQDPYLVYPDYYLNPFHAYDEGNLSWLAAAEAEPATMSISRRAIPNASSVDEANKIVRGNWIQAIKLHHKQYSGNSTIEDILDIGCSVGISTSFLADGFPSASEFRSQAMAAAATITSQLLHPKCSKSHVPLFRSKLQRILLNRGSNRVCKLSDEFQSHCIRAVVCKASSDIVEADNEDGVSLGTMKLPIDVDIPRFETLLFQWANSLCQGANLPLPMPLKVDKIEGGARLAFIMIEDAKTEVLVYIDCLVFPGTDSSPPVFRAIRNGPSKDVSPPGEPRIMKSLLQALAKSVEIARV